MCRNTKSSKGFTLVELSIVIIIIGLLIAGVSAGTSLYQQARLNAVIDEVRQYQTAINLFKAQYNAIPGDFANAWAYWNPNCGGGDPNICNGNGDGIIEWSPDGGHEDLTAWEHLSLAGLIGPKLVYTGALDIGVSVPRSRLGNGSGYWFQGFGDPPVILNLGTKRAGGDINDGALTPSDASAIDTKIDDGKPGQGSVQSRRAQSLFTDPTICMNVAFNDDSNLPNAVYLFNDPTSSCSVAFYVKLD